jgi:hypothetical protein
MHSTWAGSTLITLFLKNVEIFNKWNIWEYIICLNGILKFIYLFIYLFIWQTCVEVTTGVWYTNISSKALQGFFFFFLLFESISGRVLSKKKKKKDAYFWGYLLFCFILISWGCFTCPTFFLFFLGGNEPIWLAHHKKKKKKKKLNYGGSPNRRFYGKMECVPFWSTYI